VSDPLVDPPAHDMYTHRNGRVCILLEDGTWFVPLDIGGEGYDCEMDHGTSRKHLARAWSAFLDTAMDARLDDGTPVLQLVLAINPDLRNRLDKALRGTT
jgi:hypothetical protein